MSQMKDQYLKFHDIFDSEHNRFWNRFNLFTGMQLIVVAGIASNYDKLIKEKFIFVLLAATALAFSVFTILVVWRSYQINIAAFQSILDMESKDESLILFKTYIKYSKSPLGTIVRYCVVMSVLLTIFWTILIIKVLVTQPVT